MLAHHRTSTSPAGRRSAGRSATFQNTRFILAELQTETTIARTFLDECIRQLNAGELTVSDAAKAKWWTTELQNKVADRCLQLHGGYGYMEEYPISRAWRDTRVQSIYGGTTEIMKEIIGRSSACDPRPGQTARGDRRGDPPTSDVVRVQRRTLGVLSGAVALGGLGVTVGITVGGLLAARWPAPTPPPGSGRPRRAGVRPARRPAGPDQRPVRPAAGLAAAYPVAASGAALPWSPRCCPRCRCCWSGCSRFGASTACSLQARYAAADLAAPERRGARCPGGLGDHHRLGPRAQPRRPGADLGRRLGLPRAERPVRRSAVAFAVVGGRASCCCSGPTRCCRPPARRRAGAPAVRPRRATGAALGAVWRRRRAGSGLAAVVVAHSVMVGVMVMTPVHMGHAGGDEGTTLRVIGLVISVHVAGMYLFSPLVGLLADRVGRSATVASAGCAAARRGGPRRHRGPGRRPAARRGSVAARPGLVVRADRRARRW